jgi:hypothetical protein
MTRHGDSAKDGKEQMLMAGSPSSEIQYLSLAFVALVATIPAGCGDDGEPASSTTTSTTTPVLVGCANFDNWDCMVAGYMCFATCEGQQIACDGAKCARATSATSSVVCPEVEPEQLPDCGDCRVAFDAGCK